MKILLKSIVLAFILLINCALVQTVAAQPKTKNSINAERDSLNAKRKRRTVLMRSFRPGDVAINNLRDKIVEYNNAYIQVNDDLMQGFDTLEISERLPALEKRMGSLKGAIYGSGTISYLVAIRDIIDHVTEEMKNWQVQLDDANDRLDNTRNSLNTFKKDTDLTNRSNESLLRAKYDGQIDTLNQKWNKIDAQSKNAIIKIGDLSNRVSLLHIQLLDMNDRIDMRIHEFTVKAMSNEFGYLWAMQPKTNSTRTDTALAVTYKLNSKLYAYFFINKANYLPHIICIAVLLIFLIWMWICKRKIKRISLQNPEVLAAIRYSIKNPFCSVLAIITVLIPYFYDHPPLVFVLSIHLIMVLAIGVLIKNNWPKALFNFWLVMLVVGIVFSISNLMTVITVADRLVLVAIAIIAGIASVWLIKIVSKQPVLYPPYLVIALRVFVAVNAVSLILNISGRFSLAKIIMAGGIFNLTLAMALYLFVQIVMESLLLQFEAGKAANSEGTFIDFEELQKKLKDVVIKIVAVLWLIALARNLVIDDYIYDQASAFLSDPHTFSATAFTFGSILIFIIVIWVSGLLARVISYLYDFKGQQQSKLSPKEKKTRSSILLIRLAIFTIGFFIAISASGIPMDRITIVIGALGVGIGFGLQNIVNNLISGVILAFEKPIQVGDVIEVSGKSGTIKEIGIRSSKIDCGDGSELIVPNGDLISQHVINWTLTNNNRRIELIVGVAYGSDVAQVEALLRKIVTEHPDIMQIPAPAVHLVNFSDSSIDFRLLFWAADISKFSSLKSSVMSKIYVEFTAAGIEIPHPKRDIQVYFPEGKELLLNPKPDEPKANN